MAYEYYNPNKHAVECIIPALGTVLIPSGESVPSPEQEKRGLETKLLQDYVPSFLKPMPPTARRRLFEAESIALPEDLERATAHLPEFNGEAERRAQEEALRVSRQPKVVETRKGDTVHRTLVDEYRERAKHKHEKELDRGTILGEMQAQKPNKPPQITAGASELRTRTAGEDIHEQNQADAERNREIQRQEEGIDYELESAKKGRPQQKENPLKKPPVAPNAPPPAVDVKTSDVDRIRSDLETKERLQGNDADNLQKLTDSMASSTRAKRHKPVENP